MRALAATLALCLALAGCLQRAEGSEGTGADPRALAPLEIAGCREQIGIFAITDADARPFMPEGFAPLPPLPPDLHPDADPTGASATLLFVGFFCDAPEETTFLVPWIPAMPPEELRMEGVTYHAVAPKLYARSENVAAWAASAGLPFANATIAQEQLTPETPAAITTRMDLEGEGVALALTGSSPKNDAPTPAEWLRVFLYDGQRIAGILDLHIGEHLHWQFGTARVEAAGDGLPSPRQPGLSTHSAPGFAMTMTSVPREA